LRTLPVIFYILCLTPISGTAQGTISQKLEWFDNFFREKGRINPEEAQARAMARIANAQREQDKISEAFVRKELGMILFTRVPDYENAISQFIYSLKIEDSLGLRADQVITYLALARVFDEVGDPHKSSELLEHAMELSEPFNDVKTLVYITNWLGRLNAAQRKYDAAFENYELVLRRKEEVNDPRVEGEALFNIAHVHTLKGQYQEALKIHKQALAIWRKIKDRLHEAQSLNDIGELYRLMKNDQKALENHAVALRIRAEISDERGLAQSYNNAGILYYNQQNYARAVANLNLALEAAIASQSVEQRAKSHEYLSYCHKQTGDFKEALLHKEQYIDLIEFQRNEKTEAELLESQNRYVLDKKELEIRQLELEQKRRDQELASQKKIQNFLFALIGFGLIIVMLVLYLYLIKRRTNLSLQAAHARVNQQKTELEKLNATKDKFFSIISHDLKGPLNSFTAFSKMLIDHTESLTKEEIQMLAREIDKNLKNLFTLLENLLEWSRSQTGNIDFKQETVDLNALLHQNRNLLNTQASNKGISIIYDNNDPVPVQAHKHSVNTVIRNLISNAIKFTPEGGTITLKTEQREGKIKISVQDTGVGMEPAIIQKLFRIDTKYSTTGTAHEKGTGLGLILCKDFIEKNGGTIGVESEPGKGSIFFFYLPVTTTDSGLQPSAPATAAAIA
jgi:signal transduction histidine kinase